MLTDLGWLSPRNVLAGPPIFQHLRPFAPAIKEYEPLWRALRLKKPSPDDCLAVLKKVASRRSDEPDTTEDAILLETLRTLAKHHEQGETVEHRKLAGLACGQAWVEARPPCVRDRRPRPLLPGWTISSDLAPRAEGLNSSSLCLNRCASRRYGPAKLK